MARGAKGPDPKLKKRVDPIEAKRRKMAASLAQKRKASDRQRVLTPRFVVIVKPNYRWKPSPEPPTPAPAAEPPPPEPQSEEDILMARIMQARKKLLGD